MSEQTQTPKALKPKTRRHKRHKFFVAGTDTDVGKTLISCGLLLAANAQGLSTLALKPLSAGCEATAEGLRNDDALQLMAAMSVDLPYEQVNPVAFEAAIAPHIAAAQEGRQISGSRLVGFCRGSLMTPADFSLIEGAGGWRLPLNPRESLSMLPRELQTPVILVVGLKLGCINHTLLTIEAIERDGLRVAGWVANCIDAEMSHYAENVESLKYLIDAPCLGEVPFLDKPSAEAVQSRLCIDGLLV